MKYESCPVSIRFPVDPAQPDGKKEGREVGTVEVPVFDSWNEVVDWQGESDAVKLDVFNTQIKTRAQNKERDRQRERLGLGPVSKTALKNEVLAGMDTALMTKIITEASAAGKNPAVAMQEWVDNRVNELKAERAGGSSGENGEDSASNS